MKEGKARLENKGLVVLLCVLLVIIVGLGVGVIVSYNAANYSDGVDVSVNDGCYNWESLFDINVCIEEFYDRTENMEMSIGLYNEAIDVVKQRADYELAAKVVSSRTGFLALNGYCSNAMDLLHSEDLDVFSAMQLEYIYSSAVGSSIDCGDEDAVKEWSERVDEVGKEVKDAEGF